MVQLPNSMKIHYNRYSGRLTESLVHHLKLVFFQNEEMERQHTRCAVSFQPLQVINPVPGPELCNDHPFIFKSFDGTFNSHISRHLQSKDMTEETPELVIDLNTLV